MPMSHVSYFSALMKPEFTDASIDAVDELICDAQKCFLDIEAYSRLWKPKNHFAQHIPSDIKLFGPPRTYWCMRFEAKNQDHKRAAKMSNFINVPKTVAEFWAVRSARRLGKKRKRTDEIVPERTRIHYCGLFLDTGTWILVKPVGPFPLKLAVIDSIVVDSNGEYTLSVTGCNVNDALSDDGQGGLCAAYDFMDSIGEPQSLLLKDIEITELVAVEQDEKVWFVEQP